MVNKIKSFLLSGLIVVLLFGGMLFGGSDIVFPIPWGQLIAVAMWITLLFVIRWINLRSNGRGPEYFK